MNQGMRDSHRSKVTDNFIKMKFKKIFLELYSVAGYLVLEERTPCLLTPSTPPVRIVAAR